VFRLQSTSFAAFIKGTGGHAVAVAPVGEETAAHRFRLGRVQYCGVMCRFRNVLATCVSSLPRRESEGDVLIAARAQQARTARALQGLSPHRPVGRLAGGER